MADNPQAFPRARDTLFRARIEHDEGWREAIKLLPELKFPASWAIKVIPPFGGALAHFVASKGEASVSVYADFNEALGYFGEPHWEIYPGPSGDNERFPIADAETLIAEIGKSLRKQNHLAAAMLNERQSHEG